MCPGMLAGLCSHTKLNLSVYKFNPARISFDLTSFSSFTSSYNVIFCLYPNPASPPYTQPSVFPCHSTKVDSSTKLRNMLWRVLFQQYPTVRAAIHLDSLLTSESPLCVFGSKDFQKVLHFPLREPRFNGNINLTHGKWVRVLSVLPQGVLNRWDISVSQQCGASRSLSLRWTNCE